MKFKKLQHFAAMITRVCFSKTSKMIIFLTIFTTAPCYANNESKVDNKLNNSTEQKIIQEKQTTNQQTIETTKDIHIKSEENDDDYFNDVYQMYDRQENSAYYTGLSRRDSNSEHDSDMQNKNEKLKSKLNHHDCQDGDDECIDEQDRNYGLQMQDDYEDNYEDDKNNEKDENNDKDNKQTTSRSPTSPLTLNKPNYNIPFIYKILVKESVSDADFNSNSVKSNSSEKSSSKKQSKQKIKKNKKKIKLTTNTPIVNNDNLNGVKDVENIKHDNDNDKINSIQVGDKDKNEEYINNANIKSPQDEKDTNEDSNQSYIDNANGVETLNATTIDFDESFDADFNNKNSQQKNINQTIVDMNVDGNFEFATSDIPTPQYMQYNFGKGDKFARNMDVRASFFVNTNFERKINEDVSLTLKTQLDVGSNANYDEGQSLNVNKAFLQLKVKNGSTTELGISKLVSENLRVDASTFAKGSGGIDGDIFRIFSNSYSAINASSNTTNNPTFITVPRSPFYSGLANSAFLGNTSSFNVNHGNAKVGQGDDFASFSYYTRRFGEKGKIGSIKFAASFVPITEDLQSKKSSNLLAGSNISPSFIVTNAYSAVVNYYKSFASNRGSFILTISHDGGRVGLDKQLTNAQTSIARNDINITTAGFNLEYLGFIIGSSYSNWGKSMYYVDGSQIATSSNSILTNSNGNDTAKGKSYYYTNGIGYSVGPIGISLGMIKSKFIGNRFENYTLSTQYDIATNESYKVRHFVELSRFEFNPDKALQNIAIGKYAGYAIITGFKVQI